MQRLSPDEIDNSVQAAAVMRPLTDALGATDVALNYYELEPGDSFAFAYHDHEVQEELFVVLSGVATFDTGDGPVEVGPKEIIRFGRKEFQRGWNRGDERVVALAIGAPLDYGRHHKLRDCPACGERTDNELSSIQEDGERIVLARCKECGTETGRWYDGSMEGRVP